MAHASLATFSSVPFRVSCGSASRLGGALERSKKALVALYSECQSEQSRPNHSGNHPVSALCALLLYPRLGRRYQQSTLPRPSTVLHRELAHDLLRWRRALEAVRELVRRPACVLGRVTVQHEEGLQQRHREVGARECRHETLGAIVLRREELEEHAAQLRGRGGADVVGDVNAARADECGVEAIEVVGRHEEYALLARRHAVKRIEQTREGDVRGATVGGFALDEGGVHVLSQNGRAGAVRGKGPVRFSHVIVVEHLGRWRVGRASLSCATCAHGPREAQAPDAAPTTARARGGRP